MMVSLGWKKLIRICGVRIVLTICSNVIGESGPNDPEKSYRAAVLKNRFADTILKAREKTLSQVGHSNPVVVAEISAPVDPVYDCDIFIQKG